MGKAKKRKRSRSGSRSNPSRGSERPQRENLARRLEKLERSFQDGRARSKRMRRSHNSRSTSRTRSSSSYRGDRSPTDNLRDSTPVRGPSRDPTPDSDGSASSILTLRGSPTRRPLHNIENNLPENVLIINNDINLDEETLQCLGEDPAASNVNKIELHTALVPRWLNTLSNGIDKDLKGVLLHKYPAPTNCPNLKAPELNAEIVQIISPISLKRDKYQALAQSQLGVGITALGTALDMILKENNDFSKSLLPPLSDAAKILTDLHHTLSISRRSLITPQFNRSAKQIAITSPIDNYLYGPNFGERCKAVKDMERSSRDLKPVPVQSDFKKSKATSIQHKTVIQPNHSLNRRGPSRTLRDSRQQGPAPLRRWRQSHKY